MRQLTLFCAVLLSAGNLFAQGVLDPQGGRYPDAVEVYGDDSVADDLSSIPVDDSGKWQVILFTGPDVSSQRISADFRNHPQLQQIAAWGHFNEYQWSRLSQRARFAAYRVQPQDLPVVVVHPPKGSREYPYYYAFRQSYSQTYHTSTAIDLARYIVGNVRAFVARHAPGKVCPGPDCTPQPAEPRPAVNPLPALPAIPDIGPVRPKPATPDNPGLGEFPEYPQLTVIVDPNGLGERLKARSLETIVEIAAKRFPGVDQAKARVVRLDQPEAKAYPVDPADTPAVFVTNRGKIVGYLNRGTLALLQEFVELPEHPEDGPRDPEYIVAPPAPDTGVLQALLARQAEAEAARAEADQAKLEQAADAQSQLLTLLATLGGGGIGSFVLLGVAALYVFRKRGGVDGLRERNQARAESLSTAMQNVAARLRPETPAEPGV